MVFVHKQLSEQSESLKRLLLDICPKCEKKVTRSGKIVYMESKEGEKSIPTLAYLLGITSWGLNKWIHKGRIPAGRVNRLCEIAEGRVAQKRIYPFVFNDEA
jgi:hypothetical protein